MFMSLLCLYVCPIWAGNIFHFLKWNIENMGNTSKDALLRYVWMAKHSNIRRQILYTRISGP